MSMPSSSALVETTARTPPSRSPFSISRRLQRQVAAAVAADPLRRRPAPLEVVLQIRRQDLGGQAALREHDELQVSLQELRRDAARLAQIRAADAELMVHDRRIDEHEELLAARRAALSTSSNGCSVSRSASSRGLAIVADEQRNTGFDP